MPRRAASFFSDDQDSSEPSQPTRTDNQCHKDSSSKHSKKVKKCSKKDHTKPAPTDKQECDEQQIVCTTLAQQTASKSEQNDCAKSISVDSKIEISQVSKAVKSHKKDKHDSDHPKKKRKHDKSISKHSKHKSHAVQSTVPDDASVLTQDTVERKHRHSHRSKDPTKHSYISSKSHTICQERNAEEKYDQVEPKHKSDRVTTQKSSSTRHLTTPRSVSPSSRGGSSGSRSSCENQTAALQRPNERISQEVQQPDIPHLSKSRKRKSTRTSRSPPLPSTSTTVHQKPEVTQARPSVIDHPTQDQKSLAPGVSHTKRSRSPVERSPPKIRRYDSHTLSYGYRQESHRQYTSSSSSRYKSRSKHHRDRSRSASTKRVSRQRTPSNHGEHSKPKSKSRITTTEAHESDRSSRKTHRSVVSKHSAEPYTRDSKREKISCSPSPRASSRTEPSHFPMRRSQDRVQYASRSHSRGHSHSHSGAKRDKRAANVDNEAHSSDYVSTDKSSTNRILNTEPVSADSRSPSPKSNLDKESKLETLADLINLLTQLDTEEISDTELSTLVPPPLFSNQSVPRDLDSKQTPKLESSLVITTKDSNLLTLTQNSADAQKESDNFTQEDNESSAIETLEKLSSQVRKHMSEPETWDLTDLSIPYEADEDHTDLDVNPSVVSLASRKIVPQQQQQCLSSMLASLCTPWQELIDSATKNMADVMTDRDLECSVQPLGALLEHSNEKFVPLHKRATGVEALRLAGISLDRLGPELTNELCNQYPDLQDSVIKHGQSLAWGYRSSLTDPCSSLKIHQLCNQLQPRTFGNRLDLCIPYGAHMDLTLRGNLLGLTKG